ncbi:glycosyltransferase family 32 protein [Sparassis latifolia]|uniref:Glycosyltransferase family 32 protein n=1 Tax=Sparassis crispa TaxID=139825 RepID=A0A401GNJ9_9APHY|nr:glycosyltransferase family 32 protein [Sparassis crispa]GBE83795.1 glycosyltransferase family 32 protein [Sparassis crispa]
MSRAEYVLLPLHASDDAAPDADSRAPSPVPHQHSRGRSRWSWIPYSLWRPRTLFILLKIFIPVAVLVVVGGLLLWEPYFELIFYRRAWVRQEIEHVLPLAGCFNPDRVSSLYNVTEALYGQRRTEVHAGLRMPLGMDCYAFAGTIPAPASHASMPLPTEERTTFHTYWRSDLAPFTDRQEWLLKSFFATQNINTSRLILWSNGDLSGNAILQKWVQRFPDAFVLRIVDYSVLSRGTALDGSKMLRVTDAKAWIDGDLVRLLVLWAHGGVWVDMDSLLARDLTPLLEHEFVTQWDCVEKNYQPFNGALMRFHQYSPYLCEAFHIIATSKPPRRGSNDWGALLYLKLWRRLVAASVPPFKVLPWCFTDGRSCWRDIQLPDPYSPDPADGRWTAGLTREAGGGLDKALNSVFSVHLHNQYEKLFPPDGWVERLLLSEYEKQLGNDIRTPDTGEL